MINRFNTAMPTTMSVMGNTSARQARVENDFGLLLNSNVTSVSEQQDDSASPEGPPMNSDSGLMMNVLVNSSAFHDEVLPPANSVSELLSSILPTQSSVALQPQLLVTSPMQGNALESGTLASYDAINSIASAVAEQQAVSASLGAPPMNSDAEFMKDGLINSPTFHEEVTPPETGVSELLSSVLPTQVSMILQTGMETNYEAENLGVTLSTNDLTTESGNQFARISAERHSIVTTNSASLIGTNSEASVAAVVAINTIESLPAGETFTVSSVLGEVHTKTHSSNATGEIEFVAVPWHLQANASLSYQTTVQRMQFSDDRGLDLAGSVSVTENHAHDQNQLQKNLKNVAAFEDSSIEQPVRFSLMSEAASEFAAVSETARTLRLAGRGSVVMWPQRVVHWLSDGDTTTAWVRDYQIDTNDKKTLEDALRCLAEQQGFSLRRIMLNGHELWRAPSTF